MSVLPLTIGLNPSPYTQAPQALRINALRDIARSDASTDRLLEIITGKDNFNGCIAEERLTDGRFLKTSR